MLTTSSWRVVHHESEQKRRVDDAGGCGLLGHNAGVRLSAGHAACGPARLLPRHGAGVPDAWNGHEYFVLPDPREKRCCYSNPAVFFVAIAETGLCAAPGGPGIALRCKSRVWECTRIAAAKVSARRRLRTSNLKLLPFQVGPEPSCAFARPCALRARS